MKISLNWLKQYLDLPYSPTEIGEMLTSLGLEVEGQEDWVSIPGKLEGIVVGHVLTCGKHPGADKLSLTTVDVGLDEPIQIVCGAPNVAQGQHVLVATVGSKLYPIEGEPFKIKKGKIRGEVSYGMICAEDEIGLGQSHDGILVLEQAYKPGTPAAEIFAIEEDIIFDIGLTPNRSDATSHRGVAADLRAYLIMHKGYKQELKKSSEDIITSTFESVAKSDSAKSIKVSVTATDKCQRYAGVVLDNIQIGESPTWIKNRLNAIGVRPINNIVDATNYILHDIGQPLHAFDYDKIASQEIEVKTLPSKTKFLALDESERQLSDDDLMICDGEGQPMCIAGVFGGLNSGVTENTTSIFLESAFFESRSIRRSSTRHLLFTDAARTFEKGVDPLGVTDSLKDAVALISEVSGAKIASQLIEVYPTQIEPKVIDFHYAILKKLGGVDMTNEEVNKILNALNFEIHVQYEDQIELSIPTNRADVLREVDVVEEVLRVYGFDNIQVPEQIKLTPAVGHYPSDHQLRKRVASYFIGQGYHETMGLSLVPSKIYDKLDPSIVDQLVLIHNTSTVELDAMRPNLIPTGLQAITYNQNRQQMNLKFFENGKGYLKDRFGNPTEKEQFIVWSTGVRNEDFWASKEPLPASYSQIKGLVFGALKTLGLIVDTEKQGSEDSAFTYNQEFFVDGELVATIGQIAQPYCEYFDTKSQVIFAGLLHWDAITSLVKGNKNFKVKEISKFPQVTRDLALIVDKSVTFGALVDLVKQPSGKLVKQVNLFDVYEDDEKLGADKRSYAIRFLFERLDRTLKDKEVDKVMSAIVNVIETQPTMEVRR